MNIGTLCQAMPGLSTARAGQLVAGCNEALTLAGCSNVNRAAMFLAQIGEESGSLQWPTEFASGAEYEGRADLGNTQPGDGPRFKGRGFIQITGRHNYGALSAWAHAQGLVPTPSYFIDNPDHLSTDPYVWLGPVWYWTVARPQLNGLADARDIQGATRAVNGGLNGLADRTNRWRNCLTLGAAILPTSEDDMPTVDDLWNHKLSRKDRDGQTVETTAAQWVMNADLFARDAFYAVESLSKQVAVLSKQIAALAAKP